jgi:hypothetical protein
MERQGEQVVFLVGGQQTECEDRNYIHLPPLHVELAIALLKSVVNKPLVLILVHGGPVAIDNYYNFSAIIDALFPSMRGLV